MAAPHALPQGTRSELQLAMQVGSRRTSSFQGELPRFRGFVFEHARAARLPTLLVTHDPQDAEASGGPIINL